MTDKITSTSQIPVLVHTPASAQKVLTEAELTGKQAAVILTVSLLSHHADPLVQAAAKMLVEQCVNPWLELTEVKVEATEPDFYDLVLPAMEEGKDGKKKLGKTKHIGRDESCDTRIDVEGIGDYHVEIKPEKDKDGDGWVATLSAPGYQEGPRRMKIGDENYVAKATSGSGWGGVRVGVEPGDVLELGLNYVRLHAPEGTE